MRQYKDFITLLNTRNVKTNSVRLPFSDNLPSSTIKGRCIIFAVTIVDFSSIEAVGVRLLKICLPLMGVEL